MQELLQVLRDAVKKLESAGVESAEYDARLLLAKACGVSLAELNKALILGDLTDFLPDYASKYSDFVSRRASREPLQHIVGRAPFRYLDLQVGKGVFVPRPETEIVVEAGLDWLRESGISKPTVVDLCAGSGAIGLSIATEVADAQVWAVEKSPEAFQYLQKNFEETAKKWENIQIFSRYHAVLADATKAHISDLIPELHAICGKVDLVITNPPYVPESQVPEQVEVREYDPPLALYGGSADGLAIPEQIMRAAFALLRRGGAMVMEHDISQGDALADYAKNIGFISAKVKNDLTNRARFVVCKKEAKNE
ncbi:peptide chain release factor N(5)-glutamine methyltransferase [Gardnerella greenwoodii]|uniref:Peptide chain release factor N(5)-glutamine methyltransferase n=1 Tax=Gardnerella greenwoodii TaxID=2914925 RepID=A0A2N6RX61_9BIFI|nr:peptide chain release factor N(5)-glutamine methyltransferase [Gardnerella greenwoodii]MDF0753754.1 peptide chain release factor N(5)-glutamine methyltransferase [Gardnerella greenwoodii]PMC42700.1 peptide chain release factor N(5)-glutamine methyltransferase [Gardnerella greenwoodii]